jgi:putative hydrolase of the HAD superfamily
VRGAPRVARIDAVDIVLLDLDDTLLDYSGGVDISWQSACTAVAAPAGVDAEALVVALVEARRWFWADPARHRRERVNMLGAWTQIAARALAGCGCSTAALAGAMAEDYAARRREAMRLFPDALVTLERLRASGATLGLVTNGDARQQRDKIERHDLARFFEVIVIEGEFGAGKPDAAVYHHALKALRAHPAEAVMIGDHLEFDVGGSQRVGMRGIWVDRAGEGLPADSDVRPHRIVRALTDLHTTG